MSTEFHADKNDQITSLKKLGRLLDDRFTLPGTSFRFGIDGVIGLIPVVGDFTTATIGLIIISKGVQYRVSWWVLMRMALNLIADLLIGFIPVLGDLFDFGFKSHLKNIRLMESYLKNPPETERSSLLFVISAGTGLFLLLSAIIGVSVYAAYLLLFFLFSTLPAMF